MKKILVVWLMLCGSAGATNLGIYGPTYKILETDAFDWIVNQRLPDLERNGEVAKMNTKLQRQAQTTIENPRGAQLPQATRSARKTQSLVYTLPRDVKDASGRILFKKGTTASPADILPESSKTLIFIDGGNSAQVDYALQECKKNKFAKIVLVAGKPLELMRRLKFNIYFDQDQRLINRFEITALPAKVYRQKSDLVIEEVAI